MNETLNGWISESLEWINEWNPERVNKWIPKWVNEWNPERVNKWIPKWVNEWNPEQEPLIQQILLMHLIVYV